MSDRRNIASGAPWEAAFGYSRAVRIGREVRVAGTTAVDDDGNVIAPGDPYRQAVAALDRIEHALHAAGATIADVVRTRVYVTDITKWEEVARAHGERFGTIRPASTLVEVSRLIDTDLVVEIEADAVIRP